MKIGGARFPKEIQDHIRRKLEKETDEGYALFLDDTKRYIRVKILEPLIRSQLVRYQRDCKKLSNIDLLLRSLQRPSSRQKILDGIRSQLEEETDEHVAESLLSFLADPEQYLDEIILHPVILGRLRANAGFNKRRHKQERKFTDQDFDRAAANAKNDSEIARELEVARSTISRYKTKRGIS